MLEGVRVLDLSRVLAGPLAGMALGDLGADVIKVERTGSGDETRAWGPPFDPRGQSAYYLSTNRNKLGIALDFGSPDDLRTLHDLVAGADVVLENFKPGTRTRAGLDPIALLEKYPSLIWLNLTGFGATNPRLGYDLVVQAESGWMAITGSPEGEPMKVGVALADVIAGKDAALAVVAALAARNRASAPLQARERFLEITLSRSAVAALVNVAQNVLVGGGDAGRYGNAHPNLVPYQAFRAQDGYIVIGVGNDAQWLRCCGALGLSSLGADPALATNAGRVAQRARVTGELARRIAERPASHWIVHLEAAQVPCGRVRSVREALDGVQASPLTGVPPAIPGSVRLPPPMLDEHGAEIRKHGWGVFHRGDGLLPRG
ncbi:MAG TPA: CoA transferase [Gemmatimonadaceae bacterium]|nr:CoA transferase [Gemmatimonadaceae bacterium]